MIMFEKNPENFGSLESEISSFMPLIFNVIGLSFQEY